MTERVRKRLLDALEACRVIALFTADTDFQRFAANPMMRSAVERQIENFAHLAGIA